MRRASAAVLTMIVALLVGAAPAGAAVPGQGPPTPTPAELDASVRTLTPEVRLFTPEVRMLVPRVRALREEKVQGSRTTVTISSDVLFDFDSATLTPAAQRVVDETGRGLARKPGALTVVGHTDGVGTAAYNQDLSERRAAAVADRLRPLVGSRRITTSGRSFREPVAPETRNGRDDPAGRALNRRVVITMQG